MDTKAATPSDESASTPFAENGAAFPSFASARPSPFVSEAWRELARASPESCETSTLEIVISWGNSVLAVSHLNPPRPFALGDLDAVPSKNDPPIDVRLPRELLGHELFPLLSREQERLGIVVPAGAEGYAEIEAREARVFGSCSRGKTSTSSPYSRIKLGLQEAAQLGAPSTTVPGATHLPLPFGGRIEMNVFGLRVSISLSQAVRLPNGNIRADWDFLSYFALSLGTFGGLLGCLSYFVPPLGLIEEEPLDKRRQLLLSQYLDAAAERETRQQPSSAKSPARSGGVESAPAPGTPKEAGTQKTNATRGKTGVQGPRDNPRPTLSSEESIELAVEFGMVGLLNRALAGDPDAAKNPFSRDPALGRDDLSAQGNMWGDTIADASGYGGLFNTGMGSAGNGGNNVGIGIDRISTGIGRRGTCDPDTGVHCGLGEGAFAAGRPGSEGHPAAPPSLRMAEPTVSAGIPPDVVQRIVRQNFGRFRMCYERGLLQNPSLQGRVAVRFVIGGNGSVSNSRALPGGLPDAQVASCVAQAFYGLSFPEPENGVIRVTYPLVFSPG